MKLKMMVNILQGRRKDFSGIKIPKYRVSTSTTKTEAYLGYDTLNKVTDLAKIPAIFYIVK
jgi:hypothetical protein